jgi:hypothetical protein
MVLKNIVRSNCKKGFVRGEIKHAGWTNGFLANLLAQM